MSKENLAGNNGNNLKHISVNVTGKRPKVVGENLSKRLVMDVVDETGKKNRVFFTENKVVNEEDIFNQSMRFVKPPADFRELDKLRAAVLENRDGLAHFRDVLKEYCHGNDYTTLSENEALFARELNNIKEAFRLSYQVDPKIISKITRQKGANYLLGLMKSAADAAEEAAKFTGVPRMMSHSNINRRNNAIYDFAELLDMRDLIPLTSTMTVINGNTEFHGNYMLNAKGYPAETFDGPAFKDVKLSLAPSAYRQLSNLQVLDFLCGNVDRHSGNMFFQVDTSDPDDVKINGFQGIDNDYSFGTLSGNNMEGEFTEELRAYDMMSLIGDIKVIDEQTAAAVMRLKPEEMESKIRLVGLSANEIDAAKSRLKLLQDKIRSGRDIRIIKSVGGWEQLAEEQSRRDTLTTYHNKAARNIFSVVKAEINVHNNNVNLGFGFDASMLPQQNDSDIPTVNAVSMNDTYRLDDQIEFFEGIGKQVTRANRDKGMYLLSNDYQPLDEKLKAVVNDLRTIRGDLMAETDEYLGPNNSRMLSDAQRYQLGKHLTALQKAAEAYITANPTGFNNAGISIRNELNAAKNIKVYAEHARASLLEDSRRAEMNSARALAKAEARKYNIAATNHSFSKLSKRVKAISGASTEFYKNMMRTFSENGDLSRSNNIREKIKWCDALAEAAKGYLEHKIPTYAAEKKLNKKEHARVQFARDLLEYAEANKEAFQGKLREKEEYRELFALGKKYKELAGQYNKADGNDVFEASAKILDEKDNFIKDLDRLLEISEKYGDLHDMQAVCGTMLHNGFKKYMDAYKESSRDLLAESPIASLGLDPSYNDRIKAAIDKGTKVLKRKEEAAKAKEEKNKSLDKNTQKSIDQSAAKK